MVKIPVWEASLSPWLRKLDKICAKSESRQARGRKLASTPSVCCESHSRCHFRWCAKKFEVHLSCSGTLCSRKNTEQGSTRWTDNLVCGGVRVKARPEQDVHAHCCRRRSCFADLASCAAAHAGCGSAEQPGQNIIPGSLRWRSRNKKWSTIRRRPAPKRNAHSTIQVQTHTFDWLTHTLRTATFRAEANVNSSEFTRQLFCCRIHKLPGALFQR